MENKQEVIEEEVEVVQAPPTDDEKKKLDEYEQQVSTQKSKKKKIWSLLFFVLNVVIVVAIILYQFLGNPDDFTSAGELNLNGWFVVLLFALFGIGIVIDCFPVAYLVKKACGRPRFKLAAKTTMLGRYYDAVTPMAAGGQPFQVTYLMSYDVPSTASLSIPIAKLFFIQLAWFFFSTICLICSFSNPNMNLFVSIASYIGYICNFVVLFVNFFLAVSKSTGRKIVVKVLKLLQKMKIVKDYEKAYKKTTAYIEDYQTIMTNYMKNPKDFIFMFVTISLKTIITYSLPFFIYCAFFGFDISLYGDFFIMCVLIDIAASFIPLPGGTGMSEISFNAMFAMYFGGATVWAMLIYRFLTYYAFLIIGLGLNCYDFIYGKRKYKWIKRQRALQAESKEFRQEQIQNFRDERATRRKKQVKN